MDTEIIQFSKMFDAVVLHQHKTLQKEFTKVKDDLNKEQLHNLFALVCRYGEPDTIQTLIDSGATFKINNNSYIVNFLNDCAWMSMLDIYDSLAELNSKNYWANAYYYRCNDTSSTVVEPMSKDVRLASLELLLSLYSPEDIGADTLLFYAIITQNHEFVELLRSHNVVLSSIDQKSLFTRDTDAKIRHFSAWETFIKLLYKPSMYIEKFFTIIDDLKVDCPEARVDIDTNFERNYDSLILNPNLTDRFADKISFAKINKKKFMQMHCKVEYFPIYEKLGWLSIRKTREEMISYANESHNTEVTVWLLEFKNRTVDLQKERENDERKIQRELMAAPDSAYALKQIWTTQRCDGGICITNCKKDTDTLEIPAKIGKFSVVAVELSTRFNLNNLRSITIPEGVKSFSFKGYGNLNNLEEVKLPSTLTKISRGTFCNSKIKSIEIPRDCKVIDLFAFSSSSLTEVILNEGLESIETGAFHNCNIANAITIPKSVTSIASNAFSNRYTKFRVYKDSFAHKWCQSHWNSFYYTVIE